MKLSITGSGAKCRYAGFRVLIVMLSVVMFNVIKPNVVAFFSINKFAKII
jgi:hypothetical protein